MESEYGKCGRKATQPIVVTVIACGEEGRQELAALAKAGYQQGGLVDLPQHLIDKRFISPSDILPALTQPPPHKSNGHGDPTDE